MLLDISQPVTPESAVFPGDVPFSCGWTATRRDGASVNVGRVAGTPHVGTHVDAPFHYDDGGVRIGGLAIDAFIGPCFVIDAIGRAELGAELLRGLDLRRAPRVLFRTQRTTDPHVSLRDFPVLTEEAVTVMAGASVRLVGIDAPSFDPVESKDLAIHHALGAAGIVNVENLRLDDADAGRYEFLGAPVLWRDMDAAPLRAILRR